MDHAIYIKMAEPVRKTHAFLTDDATMAQEIDRVIVAGVKSRLPVGTNHSVGTASFLTSAGLHLCPNRRC